MWWQDVLWGFWNDLSAWVDVFGAWERFPFYDSARGGNWYDPGFLVGAGSPLLGIVGKGNQAANRGSGSR